MVIKDINIAPAADTAVVVRGGARPQGLGVRRTHQAGATLVKDLESEVDDLNVMIRPDGTIVVRRSVARLVAVEIGGGIQKFRRGDAESEPAGRSGSEPAGGIRLLVRFPKR